MFYKAKVTKVSGHLLDVQPMLKSQGKKYAVVKNISVLKIAGGDSEMSFSYAVDDIVLVALCGFPIKENIDVDKLFINRRNFDNSVVVGSLYTSAPSNELVMKHGDGSTTITSSKHETKHGEGTTTITSSKHTIEHGTTSIEVASNGVVTIKTASGSLYDMLEGVVTKIITGQILTSTGPAVMDVPSQLLVQLELAKLKMVIK